MCSGLVPLRMEGIFWRTEAYIRAFGGMTDTVVASQACMCSASPSGVYLQIK